MPTRMSWLDALRINVNNNNIIMCYPGKQFSDILNSVFVLVYFVILI